MSTLPPRPNVNITPTADTSAAGNSCIQSPVCVDGLSPTAYEPHGGSEMTNYVPISRHVSTYK
eukprot:4283-Pyramimonas_sp.AAC.1